MSCRSQMMEVENWFTERNKNVMALIATCRRLLVMWSYGKTH